MDAQRPAATISRRKIFKTSAAVGAAAAGMAGGAALTEVMVAPHRAAAADATAGRARTLAMQATTVEPGAVAPAVVMLTDAPTIAVDASLGNDFRVTLGTSRTMGNPSNSTNGQQIIFQVTQGTSGSAAITWDSDYEFSSGLPQPGLSAAAGQTDLIGFVYNGAKGKWLLAAFVNGFD